MKIFDLIDNFNIGLENFICDSDNVSSNSQIKDEPEVVSLEYNNHFLRSFMIDNNLTKKDLLEALGSSDYKSINSWLDGKTPIHICAMLRLCNYYGMPLDGFFLKNGEKTIIRPLNDFEAQKHPTNNYGLRNGRGRKIIETLENDEYGLRADRIEIPASITGVPFYLKMGYQFKNGISEPDEEHLIRMEKKK